MATPSLYYVRLIVGDPEKLAPFYSDVLGLKETHRVYEPEHVRPHFEIFMSSEDQNQLILMKYLNQPTPVPGEARVAFLVENVDAAVAAAQAGGGTVVLPAETLEKYNFRWATVADPEGHTLEVMQFGV